jgi:putative hydrolase of the HAD superfamily
MALSWVLFDWGDTLMSERGPEDLPMALWPTVRAIDGAREVLAALSKSVKIAVATNAMVSDRAAIRQALDRAGLDAFVSEVFCFRELALKKAEGAFWDAVVARLEVGRQELLMVGDDLEGDVLAPRRCGIASVWFNWKEAPVPEGVAVPMIGQLVQLPALIDRMFAGSRTA